MTMMIVVMLLLRMFLLLIGVSQYSNADAFGLSSSSSSASTVRSFTFRGGTASTTAISSSSSSSDLPYGPPTPTKVLVTGASGRTGQLVFSALLDDPRFEPVALVRSERSAKKLLKWISSSSNNNNKKKENGSKQQQQPKRYCRLDQIVVCDVVTKLPQQQQQSKQPNSSKSTNSNDDTTTNNNAIFPSSTALQDCTAMIICTSAVPVLLKRSLLSILLNIPRNFFLRRNNNKNNNNNNKKLIDFSLLRFGWKQNQYPELVDYYGTMAQIDWAKEQKSGSGITPHVVLVGSMGGTDPSNFLNRVGKRPDGTGNGDILLWKRKAERYLVESGLDYTIIHPGGLLDTPPGVEEFILDVDDVLLQQTKRSISRADVANLCVAALVVGKNKRVSLDCITQPIPAVATMPTTAAETTTTTTTTTTSESNDMTATGAAATIVTTPKTAEQVLAAFLETGKTANYEL